MAAHNRSYSLSLLRDHKVILLGAFEFTYIYGDGHIPDLIKKDVTP